MSLHYEHKDVLEYFETPEGTYKLKSVLSPKCLPGIPATGRLSSVHLSFCDSRSVCCINSGRDICIYPIPGCRVCTITVNIAILDVWLPHPWKTNLQNVRSRLSWFRRFFPPSYGICWRRNSHDWPIPKGTLQGLQWRGLCYTILLIFLSEIHWAISRNLYTLGSLFYESISCCSFEWPHVSV